MRIIATMSGGKSSAWCADWALRHFDKDKVVLYFNDTKWEHPDLYRFIEELSSYWNKEITYDSDGRSPENLFYEHHAFANNRMPFCSRILKCERLQKFYRDGDMIIFGIGNNESHRAYRLIKVYEDIAMKKHKYVKLLFPLIAENVTSEQIDKWIESIHIDVPIMYRLGFEHNNCSGGCVRAGKKQWKKLYETLPEVYLDRERVEKEVQAHFGMSATILRNESLANFRGRIERGELSAHYK